MKSTVAAHSLRATLWPSVVTPVTWDEIAALAQRNASPLVHGPQQLVHRLARTGDLLAPMLEERVTRLRPSHVDTLAS